MPNFKFNGKTGAYESDKNPPLPPNQQPSTAINQPAPDTGINQKVRPYGQADIQVRPQLRGDTPATYEAMLRDTPGGLAQSPYQQELQRLYAAGQTERGGGGGGAGTGPIVDPGRGQGFQDYSKTTMDYLQGLADPSKNPFGASALGQRLNEINVGAGMVNEKALADFQNRTGQGPGDPAYEKMKQEMGQANSMPVNAAKNEMAQMNAQYGFDVAKHLLAGHQEYRTSEDANRDYKLKYGQVNAQIAQAAASASAGNKARQFAQQMGLLDRMGRNEKSERDFYLRTAGMDTASSHEDRDFYYTKEYNKKAMALQEKLGMQAAKSGKKDLLASILGTVIGGGIGFAVGGPGGALKGAGLGMGLG